jgi:adenosine deaminase
MEISFMTTLEQQINALPKVELHSHLEGSVRAHTVLDFAQKNGVRLHSEDPDNFYSGTYEQDAFFKQFFGVCEAMATPQDCSRAICEVLCDQVAAGNVRYSEMFIQPTMHQRMTYPQMLEGLLDGIAQAEARTGVKSRLIVAINREQSLEVAMKLVRDVIDNPSERVLGIGLDGNPYIPASNFKAAFELACAHGLNCTAHAGVPVHDIEEVIGVLGCRRVDHGYYIAEEPRLCAQSVRDEVHFTACWTLAGEYFPRDKVNSPIRKMVDAGLSVSINTDDPQIFHTNIGREFALAAQALEWNLQTVWDRVMDAARACWLPAEQRRALIAQYETEAQKLGFGLKTRSESMFA